MKFERFTDGVAKIYAVANIADAGDRPVATASAGKGDRAVGTEIIASVLHFQKGARTVAAGEGGEEARQLVGRAGSDDLPPLGSQLDYPSI